MRDRFDYFTPLGLTIPFLRVIDPLSINDLTPSQKTFLTTVPGCLPKPPSSIMSLSIIDCTNLFRCSLFPISLLLVLIPSNIFLQELITYAETNFQIQRPG